MGLKNVMVPLKAIELLLKGFGVVPPDAEVISAKEETEYAALSVRVKHDSFPVMEFYSKIPSETMEVVSVPPAIIETIRKDSAVRRKAKAEKPQEPTFV